jgi:hypothetical protein
VSCELEGTAAKLRDDLRQTKAALKRRISPPLTSPPFKDPVRPPEGRHHERLSAQGDLSHLHSISQHHSANQSRTGGGVFSPPPAIISTRRMWAAKGFLEFVDGRTALTHETLSGMAPQQPEQLTCTDHTSSDGIRSIRKP